MSITSIILGLIGISFLIFVHELGHFLAARWAGVGVKTFSLGFDPSIKGFRLKFLSWKRGETEYVVGMIPFGGYVRLLGDTPEERQGRSNELMTQPPYRRAVIFAAGAAMNILTGLVVFMFAFGWGVSFLAPEVGSVVPGSPAWEAGIRPGDRITAFDGEKVQSFMDINRRTVLGGCIERILTVKRGREETRVSVVPRISEALGMPFMGMQFTTSSRVGAVIPGSQADKAGILKGDTIKRAVFKPDSQSLVLSAEALKGSAFVRSLSSLASRYPGEEFLLEIKSPAGKTRKVTVKSSPDKDNPVPRLGVELSRRIVHFVRPESPAARFFQPGDKVESVNGSELMFITPVAIVDKIGKRDQYTFRFETRTKQTVRREKLFYWLWQQELVFGEPSSVIRAVKKGTRAYNAKVFPETTGESTPISNTDTQPEGLRPGDRIVAIGGSPVGNRKAFMRSLGKEKTSIVVVRKHNRIEAELPAGDVLGIVWDQRPEIGSVIRNSAAFKAGIRPGDRIVELAGNKIQKWSQLVETVRENPAEQVPATLLRNGKKVHLSVTPEKGFFGSLGIGFSRKRFLLRETNFLNAVLLGVKKTRDYIQQVFITLVRLLRGQVAARNLQGPVGIIHITGYVTQYGFGTLLFFLALISVNLGVLNLLPLPILDGGHLVFLLCEKIKGSPVSERVVNVMATVMFFLLIALALYVTYYDIQRLIG